MEFQFLFVKDDTVGSQGMMELAQGQEAPNIQS